MLFRGFFLLKEVLDVSIVFRVNRLEVDPGKGRLSIATVSKKRSQEQNEWGLEKYVETLFNAYVQYMLKNERKTF